MKLPTPQEPLQVYYLVAVNQGSWRHQMMQGFLNTSTTTYRSVVADNHHEALNELMDEPEFTPNLSPLDRPMIIDLNAQNDQDLPY